MNSKIRNKAILKAAGIAVFAAVFCIVGCYDLGIEPSVKPPVITTFVDIRDGKTYKKEQIGDQIWMAENLNYAADGSVSLCDVGTEETTANILVPVPGEVNVYIVKTVLWSEICDMYGRFYDWNTAMNNESSSNAIPSGVEGVCPVGWHLPSDAEWQKLIDYVGQHAGTKLKSHEFHRGSFAAEGADLYNFSALPAGQGSYSDGEIHFGGLGRSAQWWTTTETSSDSDKAYFRYMNDYDRSRADDVMQSSSDKHTYFYSVRCVHD